MNSSGSFRAVLSPARAEQVVRRSRFIGYAWPARDFEALEAALARVKAESPGATHVCFGAVVGGGPAGAAVERASDAGEPAGTAGRPILGVIRQRGLVQTAVVVVRYFGGVLLGAPGLVRAYAGTAALVLDRAPIGVFRPFVVWELRVPYSLWGPVSALWQGRPGVQVGKVAYGEEVRVELAVAEEESAELASQIAGRSGGTVMPVEGGVRWLPAGN
ncbi:MAG TPA: YigZ family protein [Firmicutes bacterium]|nr:YigZ family protein [Bacillota bacterium]